VSKAFTKELPGDEDDADDVPGLPALPAGARNYMTPQGWQALRAELRQLLDAERPRVVEIVSWAASNGDRSENGDYLYRGEERTVTIKGIDESDSLAGEVSWISPIARALLKAREGDEVKLITPAGVETIEVVEVRYPAPG